MAKVLFFNLPVYGHMNPTLPLVVELVRRGEHVIYYSSETFRPAIEQAGAIFRSVGPFFDEQTYVDENLVRVGYTLIRATQEILPNILRDVAADRPDYVLYDSLCPWGKCIAQILRVPAIASMTTLVPPPSLLHPEVLAILPTALPLMIRMSFEGRRELTKFFAITKQLHETYHIPRPQIAEVYNNFAELNIVYSTKQLQLYPKSFNESYKFVGPFIVKPFVPQIQLLQRAALFIPHGGMKSVSESLYEGVPLLIIPQAADQTFIAQRIRQLGAGKTLHNSKLNVPRLRKTAEELLASPSFQQVSAKIGASLRQVGGPTLAADEIEAFKRRHGIVV